tara:strand:+ start:936 stop:1217 length:282 start_codon:yes stop_codon:yes gene_type:complete
VSVVIAKKNNMENFNTHKWFKKQYLEEANIEEIRSPQTDFTRSQLVPRMEGMVNKETYKRFIDSLDNLLDDWYMEGFEKDDVIEFMRVIIPSN